MMIDYDRFCVLLMQPECDDILLEIWKFLFSILGPNRDGSIPTKTSTNMLNYSFYGLENIVNRYQNFLMVIEIRIESNPLWKPIIEDLINTIETPILLIHEFLERYLMERLYQYAYQAVENKVEDDLLLQRIKLLSFITFRHLQLDLNVDQVVIDNLLANACKEFNKMTLAITPTEKLAFIQASINTILTELANLHSSRDDFKPYGADEVLPLFIMIMIKSCNPYIFSNFKFIESFLNPEQVKLQLGYIFTMFESAMTYIQSIDDSSFTGMNAKEFRRRFSVTLIDRQYITHLLTSPDNPKRLTVRVTSMQERNPYDLIAAYDDFAKANDSKGMEYISSLWSLVAAYQLTPSVAQALRYILAPLSPSLRNEDIDIHNKKISRLVEFFTNEKLRDMDSMNCPVAQLERFGSVLCVLVADDYPKYSTVFSNRSLDQISKDLEDVYRSRLRLNNEHSKYAQSPGHHDIDITKFRFSSSVADQSTHSALNATDIKISDNLYQDDAGEDNENKIRSETYDTVGSQSVNYDSDNANKMSNLDSPYEYPVLFLRESQKGMKTRCFEVYQQFPMLNRTETGIIRKSCLSTESFLVERAAVALLSQSPFQDTRFQCIVRSKSFVLSKSPSFSALPLINHPSFFQLLLTLLYEAHVDMMMNTFSYISQYPLTYQFHPESYRCHDDPLLILQGDADEIRGLFIICLVYQLYRSLNSLVNVERGVQGNSSVQRFVCSIDSRNIDFKALGTQGLLMSGCLNFDEFKNRNQYQILGKIDESLFEACNVNATSFSASSDYPSILLQWYTSIWDITLRKELEDQFISVDHD